MFMKSAPIRPREMAQAQSALLLAIFLQITLNKHLTIGPRYLVALLEVLLLFGIGIATPIRHSLGVRLRHDFAMVLIALISLANGVSMVLVADDLIRGSSIDGRQLIFAAFAIFITNIIIFSLWFWELDSP